MKFQNYSMHGSQDVACIKKCLERTHGRTDGRTHTRTDNPKPICPFNFFEVGDIIIIIIDCIHFGSRQLTLFQLQVSEIISILRNCILI